MLEKISRYLSIVAILFCAGMMIYFSSCGFQVVRYEDLSEECNLAYNAMSLYQKADDKTMVAKTMEYCIKHVQRERCKKEIFKSDRINYDDAMAYREYNECLKELQ